MQINFMQASESEKQFVRDLLQSAKYRAGYSGPETVEAMREASARMANTELASRIPAGTTIEPVTIEGVPCERMTPPSPAMASSQVETEQVIFYLHGGGFVRGSLDLGRSGAAQLAAASGRTVLAIGYRQGPEHRVPAASEDLLRGYCSLLDRGYLPRNMVVVGESAGGTLALALPAWLKQNGRPAPAGLVGISPMADLRMQGASWYFNADRDFATIPMGRRMLSHYAEDSELDDPRINPVVPPVQGHNAVLLCVGSHETMLSDVEWYAHMAEAAGNQVTLHLYEAMPPWLHSLRLADGEAGVSRCFCMVRPAPRNGADAVGGAGATYLRQAAGTISVRNITTVHLRTLDTFGGWTETERTKLIERPEVSMRTLSRTLLTAALVSLSFAPLAAHAGNLTGDTILGNFESINTGSTTPFIFSSGTTTVPGAAIIAGNGYLNSQYIGQGTGVPILTWQFTANELIFSFLQTSYFDSTGLSFNGPVFTDQTNTFNTNVALNSGASTPALAALASQATVVGNTLSFNFEGLNFQSGQTLVYNVNNNATAVTPEPSGLLLLGTGVLGTAGIVRRRILA